MAADTATEQARAQLRDLAENFALTMTQGGMQKSTARVLSALLFTQQESMTAGDLCEELGISSGAVSGAVKQLSPMGLIERVPAPGSRRDHFRFGEGSWAKLMSKQNVMLEVMLQSSERGLEVAGAESPAGVRMTEMRHFYGFMLREMPALITRWREEFGPSGRKS
jgi:DNA-binding transcriptional regulator GbsR (MarR family)